MKDRFKIIIADDEQNICEMLKRLIRFDELGLELTALVFDGESLRDAIEKTKPDIVITDIHMPIMDGLEVIRWCNENSYNVSFIVLSGYHQFEYAYNALKYKVNDYLLKPVDEEELNETLKKVIKELNDKAQPKDDSPYIESIHNYFMSNVLRTASEEGNDQANLVFHTLESINREYMLKLQPGYFCFCCLCIDDQRIEKSKDEQINSIIKKLLDIIEKRMSGFCFEHICYSGDKYINILLNYKREEHDLFEKELKAIYDDAKIFVDVFRGMHITMCVGERTTESHMIPSVYKSCWLAVFARFGLGTNKVIWSERLSNYELGVKPREWTEQIKHTWDILEAKSFDKIINEIFLMPRSMQISKDFASFVFGLGDMLNDCKTSFEQRTGIELDGEEEDLVSMMGEADSLEDYKTRLLNIYRARISECSELVEKRSLKPIRLACAYVEEHYKEPIKLEDVARVVNLNPSYFSALFTRKTGQSFNEYVSLYKIKKSCELLSGSNMNINEIADTLGFTDARYFSKLFRKKMGIKPTEYRRIYG